MTRFSLWERPMSHPFIDIVTADSDPGQVFDLGIDLDGYDGSVFIKPEHIREMARELGMADKETVDALKSEITRLNRLVEALPEEAKVLENGLNELVADFRERLSNRADSNNGSNAEPEPREVDANNVEDNDGNFLEQLNSVVETSEDTGQESSDILSEGPTSIRGITDDKSLRITL